MAAVAAMALSCASCRRRCHIQQSKDLMEESTRSNFDMAEVGGGLTAEFLAGMAGVVLGILALFVFCLSSFSNWCHCLWWCTGSEQFYNSGTQLHSCKPL